MEEPLRILLVDDHQIVLEGLAELLSSSSQRFELSLAQSVKEALQYLEAYQKPHLVITDLDLGTQSGKDLCLEVRQSYQQIPVIVLSMHTEKGIVKELLRCGASGYLSKTCRPDELIAAIDAVIRGKRFYSTEVLESLSQEQEAEQPGNLFLRQLSHRELEIVRLTANGLSSKEIGDELHISHRTAEAHRANAMRKLKVGNVAGLIKVAVKNGLVD